MPEKNTGRARPKARRSTAVSTRLKQMRDLYNEQLVEQREKERRVRDALAPFARASEALDEVRVELEHELAELRRQEAAAEDKAEERRAELRTQMAEAVRTIRQAGTSVRDTSALLGISTREVRELAALAEPDTGSEPERQQAPATTDMTAAAGEDDEQDTAVTDGGSPEPGPQGDAAETHTGSPDPPWARHTSPESPLAGEDTIGGAGGQA
ncbi:hypothetical protein [Amycolatopsis anabasis]|uniref:hypothetical protein n=1 Tax=Amycolatopsis anabasis TaxID=1840409 RepID=UPI00131DA8E9|nr:hypothetical protein [Amycolatopsis anabasis]